MLLSSILLASLVALQAAALPSVQITSYPALNAKYPCTSCPCSAYNTTVQNSIVSGTIVWDPSTSLATDFKIALYILTPDAYWWAKPSFTNRYAPVRADGTWSSTIFSYCLDPRALKIVAFVIPVAADPDTLQDGRTCGCGAGPHMELEYTCLPPYIAGYASAEIFRGAFAPYMTFANRTFVKKQCTSACGPGGHQFSPDGVTLNAQGGLQLSITKLSGVWRSAEVHLAEVLGFGTYLFQVTGPLAPFDLHCTLGLFTYDDCSADAATANYRELDFEFSRWNVASAPGSQYVIQPYTISGQIQTYALNMTGTSTVTLVMDWNGSRIKYYTLRGTFNMANLGAIPAASVVFQWPFLNSANIPTPGKAKIHLNAWIQTGFTGPASGTTLTYTINDFQFNPNNDLVVIV